MGRDPMGRAMGVAMECEVVGVTMGRAMGVAMVGAMGVAMECEVVGAHRTRREDGGVAIPDVAPGRADRAHGLLQVEQDARRVERRRLPKNVDLREADVGGRGGGGGARGGSRMVFRLLIIIDGQGGERVRRNRSPRLLHHRVGSGGRGDENSSCLFQNVDKVTMRAVTVALLHSARYVQAMHLFAQPNACYKVGEHMIWHTSSALLRILLCTHQNACCASRYWWHHASKPLYKCTCGRLVDLATRGNATMVR
jgi:hypothetical protein